MAPPVVPPMPMAAPPAVPNFGGPVPMPMRQPHQGGPNFMDVIAPIVAMLVAKKDPRAAGESLAAFTQGKRLRQAEREQDVERQSREQREQAEFHGRVIEDLNQINDPVQFEQTVHALEPMLRVHGLQPEMFVFPDTKKQAKAEKDAATVIERLRKTHGDVVDDPAWQKQFAVDGVKVSDLYRVAKMPMARSEDGAAAPLKPSTTNLQGLQVMKTEADLTPKAPTAPTPGSFEEYVQLPPAQQKAREGQRKSFLQSDDRPQPQATILVQTVDESGNPVQRFVSKQPGASFPVGPNASQQTSMAEQETGLALIDDISRLYTPEMVGPVVGRVTKAQMVIPGTPDVSPQVAEFYAAVAGLRNEIIRLMSGAAVSGSEEARMRSQLPDVTDKPSVFEAKLNQTRRNRDTLLQRMRARTGGSASPPSTGDVRVISIEEVKR